MPIEYGGVESRQTSVGERSELPVADVLRLPLEKDRRGVTASDGLFCDGGTAKWKSDEFLLCILRCLAADLLLGFD